MGTYSRLAGIAVQRLLIKSKKIATQTNLVVHVNSMENIYFCHNFSNKELKQVKTATMQKINTASKHCKLIPDINLPC